jgi:hypothetical protein
MADIVDDFLQRLRTIAPEIPAQKMQQLEAHTREAWGGTKPYVSKRPVLQRVVKVGEGLRAQKTLSQVFQEAGISRRHAYRILGTKM